MRKLFLTIALILAFSLPSLAQYSKYQGWVQQGGGTVTTSGLISSTFVQRSFKTGTITVRTAAGSIATIYSNTAGTALANPFTNQNTTTGEFYFYASNGFYNIQIAATGLTTYTLGYVPLFDPTTATTTVSGTVNYLPKVTSAGPPVVYGNSRITDDGNYITVQLSGAPGLVDATAWSQSFLSRWSRLQNSSGNEFGINIQTVTNTNTGAGADYEKAALLVQAETADPSGATTRDQVGIDSSCIIWSSISTGRCWGQISIGRIIAGGDGLLYAHEFAIDNGGTDQPVPGTTTSKYILHLVAGQSAGYTTPVTAGILINSGTSTMHKGITSNQSVYTGNTSNDSFIELDKSAALTDLFRIKPSGQTLIGDLPNNGTTNDYDPTVYGSAVVKEYLSIAGTTNTNKQFMALFADTSTATHRIISSRYDGSVPFLPITVEVSGSAINRWNTDLSMEFVANGSSATVSSAGTSKLRNNNGQLELSNNGGAYATLSGGGGGGGGGGIGGSGTAGYIPVFTAVTTIGVTSSPLVEYNSGGNYTLVIGGTQTLDPAQVSLEAFKLSTTGSYILARNSSTGTTAYAGVAARIGAAGSTIDAILGVTSSGFTPSGPLSASQGFIRTGAQATAGLTIQTTAGSINFAADGTAVVFRMTTDDAFQFVASSTAAVSSAGTVKLRNNSGQLEVSNNGAAFTALPGAGGSGVGGSGTAGYIPIWTANTNLGNTTGPLAEITSGGNCLVYGLTTCDDSAQMGLLVVKASATGSIGLVRNSTSGATAYSAIGARSGASSSTIDIALGVNSAGWTYSAPFSANQGFIKTGAQATAGLVAYIVAGSFAFAVNSTAIDYRMTSDHAFEFLNTSTAALSGSGGVRLRNNAGSLEVSQNGGAYASITSGGGIGGSGTTNLGAKFTAATTIGNSTYFDNGTSSTIGMSTASDNETTIRFQIQKDQNNVTSMLVRNNTSNTLAESDITVRSGSGSNDFTMGITSAAFSTSGGIAASTAKLYSGVSATGGILIKTGSGPVNIDVTGSSIPLSIKGSTAAPATYFYYGTTTLGGVIQVSSSGMDMYNSSGHQITLGTSMISMYISSVETARIAAASATSSGIQVYFPDISAWRSVEISTIDNSCGGGYKCLRVLN